MDVFNVLGFGTGFEVSDSFIDFSSSILKVSFKVNNTSKSSCKVMSHFLVSHLDSGTVKKYRLSSTTLPPGSVKTFVKTIKTSGMKNVLWRPGNYRVEAFVNGTPVFSSMFKI